LAQTVEGGTSQGKTPTASAITPDRPTKDPGAGKAGPAAGDGERNPKKGYGSLDVERIEQFAIVERLKESYPVKWLCELFEVHRSSYRAWQARPKGMKATRAG